MIYGDDLLVLLGLPPGTQGERLRVAYEGAVAAATRRGDWDRARRLSRAFDALGAADRRTVYAGWSPSVPILEAGAAPGPRHRRSNPDQRERARTERAARDAVLTARWHMRRPYRVAVRLILWMVFLTMVASSVHGHGTRSAVVVLALGLGVPLLCWVCFAVSTGPSRRRAQRAAEILAWTVVAGLVVLIAVLAVVNARQS